MRCTLHILSLNLLAFVLQMQENKKGVRDTYTVYACIVATESAEQNEHKSNHEPKKKRFSLPVIRFACRSIFSEAKKK